MVPSPHHPVAPAPAGHAGTVYRAAPERAPALDSPVPDPPILDPPSDGSGSLTGFILSRGRADAVAPRWRMAVIVLVILLALAVLAAIGLVAVGSFFDRLLGG